MKSIALVLTLAACTETRDPLAGTQSLEIELVTPTSPGDVDHRLLDSERKVVINIRAKDAEGQLDASFNDTVRVYAQFLGTLTPDLEELPIASIAVVNGAATNQTVNLPASVLGPTTLWIDNGKGVGSEYQFGAITGTSVTLWYRDPFIRDLQTPRDEMAVDALSLTPLTDKQVRVGGSRHGATGALVITSTFAQGYTVSDVNCTTGGPMPAGPCTAGSYDHVLVFTFSAPRDQYGRPIVVGEVIASFSGGLTEFNGLTEIGFPRTYTASPDRETPAYVNRALVPPPVPFDLAWFGPLTSATGRINFERNEAGLVEFRNVKVCPIEDGPDGVYTRFKQWKVDPSIEGNKCGTNEVINLITAGTDFTTSPYALVGRTLPKVVGILRPVNLGSNIWIVYPRGNDDLQTQ